MKSLVLSLAVAASLAAAPGLASGPEALTDRSDILGWEAVGQLDIGNRASCSGALIAPDLVMTAAHCLFLPDTLERRDPTTIVFHAGYRDGETIATAEVGRAVVLPEFDPDDDDAVRYLRADIALLELVEPIAATTASPFHVAPSPREGAEVTAISYGHGRSNAASRDAGCRLIVKGLGIQVFDCAGISGASGGPIFDTSGRYPRIVSMISSGGPYEGKPAVFGAELPDAVARLKRAFRTGDGVWPKTLPEAKRLDPDKRRSAGTARFVRP